MGGISTSAAAAHRIHWPFNQCFRFMVYFACGGISMSGQRRGRILSVQHLKDLANKYWAREYTYMYYKILGQILGEGVQI